MPLRATATTALLRDSSSVLVVVKVGLMVVNRLATPPLLGYGPEGDGDAKR